MCLVLTQTESLDEALERLQAITDDADKLSPQFRILSFVLLGRVNVLLEKYDNAKELLPVLLTQLQEMGAATSPPAAAVLSDLGRLAIVDEQWGIAVERLSEAVAMNEKIGQTSSFEYGKAQLSLGIALLGKGEQQKAREQFSAAVETFSRLNRTESTEAKEAASRLAQIKPAPSTAAMTQAPLDEAVAAKLQAASEAYEAGRFDDAKQAYQQILDEASDDFEVPDLARAAAYLGKAKLSLSTDLEKFDEGALETATRDLEKLGTSPDLLRDAFLLQACVVVERRQKFLAMDLLNNDLLKIGEALPPKQQVTTLCLRSRALAIDGNAKEAVTTARLALKKAQESFGPQHIYCHSALDALGHALLTDDNETAAVEAFEESRQILRAYLNDTVAYQPFDQLASFLSVTQDSLHEAVSPLRGGGTMEQALTWVLNEKNLLPAFAARDGQIRRLLTTPDQETAYDAWRNQRSQRAAISPSVSTATGSLFEQAQIQELRQAEAAALEKLPPNVQKLLTEPIIPHVTVEDIRKALKPDELFIEIIRLNATEGAHQLALDSYTERDYFAWIVPPAGEGYLSATDLGSSLILDGLYTDDAIPVPERILQDLRDNGEQDAANKFHRSLRSLAEQIWEPISRRSIPESTKTIILSLDGELQHVPWAALPIDGSNRMLIEDYAIRYVSSGRELVQRARETSKRRQSLILSNPDFNADIPGVATAGVSAESLFPRIKAPRLSSADLEANAILADVTRYAGSPPKRLTGKEASQAAVLDVDSPFVMHLATLAINRGDDNTIVVSRSYELTESRVLLEQKSDDAAFRNPFFRCGILLAGFNLAPEASNDIDGILTGAEIIAHDLRGTELVVLSGCPGDLKESGRKIGPELLTEALRLAGA
ncbi:MAG: CHAT domain-containing protein, partial [Planctomycetaceae bacterium]|nr:CHAT domain-containing protein [Planctomycetaceae bacterium]